MKYYLEDGVRVTGPELHLEDGVRVVSSPQLVAPAITK